MKTAALLLAAGASTRMGAPKQLLEVDGETLLRRAARRLVATRCAPVIAVIGAYEERTRPEVDDLPLTVLLNPEWQTGMASSIRRGLAEARRLEPDIDAVLIALADQPLVTSMDLNALMAFRVTAGKPIAAACFGRAVGVPAVFTSAFFPALAQLQGDAGARRLLLEHAGEVAHFPLAAAAVDLDSPEDLASFSANLH